MRFRCDGRRGRRAHLPRGRGRGAALTAPAPIEPVGVPLARPLGVRSVLVVEPHGELRQTLSVLLSADGYSPRSVRSARDAMTFLAQGEALHAAIVSFRWKENDAGLILVDHLLSLAVNVVVTSTRHAIAELPTAAQFLQQPYTWEAMMSALEPPIRH